MRARQRIGATGTAVTGTRESRAGDGQGPVVRSEFCPADVDPFETVEWELRTASIKDENGGVLFEQTDCEIPVDWSPLATNVVVSKYFYGEPGTRASVRRAFAR